MIDELNVAPAFFGLTIKALLENSVLRLAKLYDSSNGSATISAFLDFIEQNVNAVFENDNFIRIKKDIIKDRENLKSQSERLLKLRVIRDRVLAHNDKKFVHSLKDVFIEQNFIIRDIRELISLGADIVNNYSVYFSGKYVNIYAGNKLDVENVLEILQKHLVDNPSLKIESVGEHHG